MEPKTTEELEHALEQIHPDEIDQFLHDHAAHMLRQQKPFSEYMHERIRENGLTQQEVFLRADVPERYGYKLLSEEKHTKQRDYLIRLSYAAGLTLEETQRALTLYGMAPLYPRIPRDAVLMIALNQNSGDIQTVNALLVSHGMEALRSCGTLD